MKLAFVRIVVYYFLVSNALQLLKSPSKVTIASILLSIFAATVIEVTAVSQRVRQAEKLHLAGDYEGAIAQFSKILRRQPGHLEALVCRAYSYVALERYEAALQDCNQAIQVRPDYETAYACRAKVKLDGAGDREGAIADLKQCLQFCDARTPVGFRDGAVAELERLRSASEPTIN